MTWVIPRKDRNTIINTATWDEIVVVRHHIVFAMNGWKDGEGGDYLTLAFDDEGTAQQSFGYLCEAIKRGDRMVCL